MRHTIIALAMIPLIFASSIFLVFYLTSNPALYGYVRPSIITFCILSMLPAVFLTIGIIYGGKTTARMIRDWYDKARKRAEKGEQKKIVKTILGDTIKFRPRKII